MLGIHADSEETQIEESLAQPVQFDTGLHVLVADRLTTVPSRIVPYWVPATGVVWSIEIK